VVAGALGLAPSQAATLVNLNSADAAAFEQLPGVGPVLADRIVQWRTSNGPFRSIDELGEVSGIGDAIMGQLRSMVTV
jgi:competence protein ComEA